MSERPSRPRLLVVDDEADMLDFVERVFRHEYDVRRASSVDEALQILERDPVSVIITDQRMPRRSGFELLECAVAMQPQAIRILLTGYAERVSASTAVDAYITKPIDADTLRQAVLDAIAARPPAS